MNLRGRIAPIQNHILSVISVHPQGAVVKPNPDGVKAADSLEMKRRMAGILFKQLELTIRKLADGHG